MTESTYSVSEVAEILGICTGTVYRAIREERLPALSFGTRAIRIPKSVIDTALREPRRVAAREGQKSYYFAGIPGVEVFVQCDKALFIDPALRDMAIRTLYTTDWALHGDIAIGAIFEILNQSVGF